MRGSDPGVRRDHALGGGGVVRRHRRPTARARGPTGPSRFAEVAIDPTYLLYRAGSSIASFVPDVALFRAAAAVGTVVARRDAKRREVVRRNLARVVDPDVLESTVDEAFRSYARYWMEALRLPKPGLAEIQRRTATVDGLDNIARYLDVGRGVIFVSPHLGSYDVAGAWLASYGWRMLAVAEELEPPELFEMFRSLRRSVGVEVLPAGKGSTARALLSALRDGGAAGLVADRDITGSGVEVEFFGEKTLLPNGPAVLALRTGAPLIVGALLQRPGGLYHGVLLDPIEVEAGKADRERAYELTVDVARRMEDLIRREPGQWHLFQPNWPTDPGYRHAQSELR
ncbi:MAG: phosphatidylinositol mannoside acyltransferase [Actinomycetota bacterium]